MIRAAASVLKRNLSALPRGVRPGRRAAFTLVEVVLAVGLVAFVLTAILGLAMMAIKETKNADLKARLTWITESVTSECQSQRFATVLGSLPVTRYWDYSGKPVDATSRDVYFRGDLKNVTAPAPPKLTANNFALLQVTISWPSPQLTSKNVFLISLFNYQ